MYAASLRRLLEMYPAGASGDQLLWRLKSSGSRASAADVLQGLTELSENGEVRVRTPNRWILARYLQPSSARSSSAPSGGEADVVDETLRAAYGTVIRAEPAPMSLEPEGPGAPWRLSGLWRELMSYYAATQRADPRGRICQFPDRHGTAWHLVSFAGDWWRNARLDFPLTGLAEGFREALLKRPERSCAIGYPLTIVHTANGPEILPALLLAAGWRTDGEKLQVEIGGEPPVINPDWHRRVIAKTSWKAEQLRDVLFPEGEDDALDAVVRRMRQALARFGGGTLTVARPDDTMTLRREGLRNAAAIFLSADRSYVQGTAADLGSLVEASPNDRAGTALAALFSDERQGGGAAGAARDEAEVLQLRDLTDSQFSAACSILSAPLTVVQGPPGTGKSDVIVSVIASAVAAGQSVLFASKNHQALDEVEQRLGLVTGDIPVITRGRDAEGDRDTNFLAELKMLAACEPWPTGKPEPADTGLASARGVSRSKRARLQRTELELKLAQALERLHRVVDGAAPAPAAGRPGLFARLLASLLRAFSSRRHEAPSAPQELPPDASPEDLRRHIDALRSRIAALLESTSSADLVPIDEKTHGELVHALRALFRWRTTPDAADRESLVAGIKELEFSGLTRSSKLVAEDARMLLKRRPVWAISTLSVPSRVPLIPGLFDLLVIDEASQCDIASALPLFYRAKRAAVVGDPMQLSFVPQLSQQQEHALMNAAGLPRVGRSRVAQSVNSLFDFTELRPGGARHFLSDQFRSAPGIVDYLNQEFYRGRLVSRREDEDLTEAPGYKSGLAWVDIKGRATRLDDQNVNVPEAEEVVRRVAALVREPGFAGTVGVLSPFVGQVGLITRHVTAALTQAEREKVRLKVATIDKFQGGEADVVFFSLVLGEGAGFGLTAFLRRERRRFNVAVSRARAVCIVVGDLSFARTCEIPHVRSLARFTTEPRTRPREAFDSLWERRLFVALQQRGLDPHAQYPVGRRSLDIALFHGGVQLDVEVDGRTYHTDPDGNRKTGDILRDRELIARGWKVRRFWVSELDRDMEGCLDLVDADLGRA